MARSRNGVNKSEAIHNAYTANPNAKSSKIIADLESQGISVTKSLVYLVKSQMKHKKRKQKREQVATASREMGIVNPVDLILKVRALAGEAGGIRKFKQLVDAMAE